jgi:undecaprenyl diphosphate synthase
MGSRVMVASSMMKSITHLPNHVAIVPDGNGRWAEQRGLSRLDGHHAGAENMRRMVDYLNEYPIKYVTLYGFSTENWSRPEEEVRGLFQILAEFINEYVVEIHNKGIKLRHLGRLGELPPDLRLVMNRAIELTKDNTGMTLSVAFNYGGRVEILDAVRSIVAKGIPPESVDAKLFNSHLYTAGLPEVDLLIRTGDELRLSNFLIWQTAYSEYYFTKVLWPDFNKKEIDKALLTYSHRQRRFGGL